MLEAESSNLSDRLLHLENENRLLKERAVRTDQEMEREIQRFVDLRCRAERAAVVRLEQELEAAKRTIEYWADQERKRLMQRMAVESNVRYGEAAQWRWEGT